MQADKFEHWERGYASRPFSLQMMVLLHWYPIVHSFFPTFTLFLIFLRTPALIGVNERFWIGITDLLLECHQLLIIFSAKTSLWRQLQELAVLRGCPIVRRQSRVPRGCCMLLVWYSSLVEEYALGNLTEVTLRNKQIQGRERAREEVKKLKCTVAMLVL